jgi:hypothetical protein
MRSGNRTCDNIVAEVSVNSYSNFHAGLFTSDGNSRGFTDGPSPRIPLQQHDLARDFIASNFQAMGFDTWLETEAETWDVEKAYWNNCPPLNRSRHGTSLILHNNLIL